MISFALRTLKLSKLITIYIVAAKLTASCSNDKLNGNVIASAYLTIKSNTAQFLLQQTRPHGDEVKEEKLDSKVKKKKIKNCNS